MSACLCGLVTGDGKHAIWVAFLDIDNDHYEGPVCGTDYMFCSPDRLTRFFTGSSLKHCQVMFWDKRMGASLTYDVNDTHKCVFEAQMKQFGRRGWTFVRINVSREQELSALDFMREQLGKPLKYIHKNSIMRIANMFTQQRLLVVRVRNGRKW